MINYMVVYEDSRGYSQEIEFNDPEIAREAMDPLLDSGDAINYKIYKITITTTEEVLYDSDNPD